MPIRITFLFGSGADSDYCEAMPSGKAFTRALLKEEGKKARKMMLGEECASLYLVTHNSRKFFLQTIDANQEEAKNLLGEQIVRQCLLFYSKFLSKPKEERVKMLVPQEKREKAAGFLPLQKVIQLMLLSQFRH